MKTSSSAGKGKSALPFGFRRARIEDAELLTGIALAGKRYWGYPSEWMEWWRHDLVVTPPYICRETVQIAEMAGEAVGFAGLSTIDDDRHLEHLWLRPEYIGRGLGRALFEEAVRLAREGGAIRLKINSDPNAEAFYLKMGAVRTGSEIYQLPGAIRREVPVLTYLIPNAS